MRLRFPSPRTDRFGFGLTLTVIAWLIYVLVTGRGSWWAVVLFGLFFLPIWDFERPSKPAKRRPRSGTGGSRLDAGDT